VLFIKTRKKNIPLATGNSDAASGKSLEFVSVFKEASRNLKCKMQKNKTHQGILRMY
jgi:hypothetical protein